MPPITVNARVANHLSDVALILQRRIVVGTVIECGAFFCENAADQDEIVAESVGDKVERALLQTLARGQWSIIRTRPNR